MRRTVATTLCFVGAITLLVHGQSARRAVPVRAEAAPVAGRVVADATGVPLPNVQVAIATPAAAATITLSDADGHFALSPTGSTAIVVRKSGYSLQRIAVAAGTPSIEIRLRRSAAISGRILDAFGEPAIGIQVVAELAGAPGPPAAQDIRYRRANVIASAATDDRGEYRLSSLPAGAVTVSIIDPTTVTVMQVTGSAGAVGVVRSVQRTYYPGVKDATEAEALSLQPGDERAGVDFTLPPVDEMTVADAARRGFAGVEAAQEPPQGTGVVRGRVLGADSRPLPRAQVRLFATRESRGARTATSNLDGQYEFPDLPAGRLRVLASKRGYFNNTVSSIEIAEGERRDLDVRLAPWTALSGHVVDEYGEGLQGGSVQVMRVRYEAGRRRLVPFGPLRITDDRGAYRLWGLRPGQYIVSAAVGAVGSADLPGYARSYFPGTPAAAEAQYVTLGDQEAVGIDIALSRTSTTSIRGRIYDATGQAASGGRVQLIPSQRSASAAAVPVGARLFPDGVFEFPNVAPGQYVVQVDRGRKNPWTEGEFGALPVTVGDVEVTNLTLRTSRGSSITGRFIFDTADASKTPSARVIRLTPVPLDPDLSTEDPAAANIHRDWTFELDGINGPRRLQLLRAPDGWALKAILVDGIDVTDRPLDFGRADQSLSGVEVVLTDRINTVAGMISDDQARPISGAYVIVYSVDRDQWYGDSRFLGRTVSAQDGTFTLDGLPFGTYHAAAVAQLPDDGPDGWQNPEFLEMLTARASTVTLGEGQRISIAVRLSTAR